MCICTIQPQEISTANFVYSIGFGLTCFTGILVTRFGGARMFGFAISAAAKINLMTSFVFSKMGIVGLLNLVFVEGVFHVSLFIYIYTSQLVREMGIQNIYFLLKSPPPFDFFF